MNQIQINIKIKALCIIDSQNGIHQLNNHYTHFLLNIICI
jgi:hypothetical protein